MIAACRPLLLGVLLSSAVMASSASAQSIVLDFSSGDYVERPPQYNTNQYRQDGFAVETESTFHEFHETFGSYGPTLAWYEHDIVIRTSFGGEKFKLESIDVAVPAYAGLEFMSSKGSVVSVGSVSGTIEFSGEGWSEIDFFTLHTTLDFDILTELDNFVVTPASTYVTPTLNPWGVMAMLASLLGLGVLAHSAASDHEAPQRGTDPSSLRPGHRFYPAKRGREGGRR